MKINFSIIIPTRNRASQIKRILNSIQHLEYPPSSFEVIIVDNDSDTDKTKTVVHSFKKKIPNLRYITEKKRGASFARNTGSQKAKYRHLIFIDDDVTLKPQFLLGYQQAWHQHPRAKIIGAGILVSPPKKVLFTTTQRQLLQKYNWCFASQVSPTNDKILNFGEFVFSANLSYRKTTKKETPFFTKLGRYFLATTQLGGEDYELCTRMILQNEKVILSALNQATVSHQIEFHRFEKSYLHKRFLLNGIELYLMDTHLQQLFPTYQSLYLQSLYNGKSVLKLITDSNARLMLWSYFFNRSLGE